MKTNQCSACEGITSRSARRCPHCGHYIWTTGRKLLAIIFVPVIVALAWGMGTCIYYSTK